MELSPVPNVAFSSNACFACYRSPPQTPTLKRCTGCKRVKFCSSECSTKEWPDHKSFCRAFSALRARPGATLPPPYAGDLGARRETHRAQWLLEDELLATALGRQPTALEGKLLYREPRCGVCWDREADVEERGEQGWRVCQGCTVMAYCGEEHENEGRGHLEVKGEDGRTQCQTFVLSNEIDEFQLRHAAASDGAPPQLWTPSRILSSPAPLPPTWESYFLSSNLPTPTPSSAEVYGVFAETLSPVLTILAALTRFNIPSRTSLVLHIINPTPSYEGSFLPLFEELLHQLPTLTSLRIFLVGPDVPNSLSDHNETSMPTCPPCRTASRTRAATWVTGEYPLVAPTISKPDLVIGFNLGLAMDDSSSELIKFVRKSGVPVLLTGRTEEEARDEVEGWGTTEWGLERNVWSGGWPRIDAWEEDGVWRNNGWAFGVRGGE